MCNGGGDWLKYLKRGGTDKTGRDKKILKRKGQAGSRQGVGALKQGGPGESPSKLWLTNVIFFGTLWTDK